MKRSKIAIECIYGNDTLVGPWKNTARHALSEVLENKGGLCIRSFLHQELSGFFLNPPDADPNPVPPYTIARDIVFCAGITCEGTPLVQVAQSVRELIFPDKLRVKRLGNTLGSHRILDLRCACLAGLLKLKDFTLEGNRTSFMSADIHHFDLDLEGILNETVVTNDECKSCNNLVHKKHPFRGDAANYIPKYAKSNSVPPERIIARFLDSLPTIGDRFPQFNESLSALVFSGLSEGLYRQLEIVARGRLMMSRYDAPS